MSLYVALARHPLVAVISNHLDTYPTPINLSYMWSFGSIAGLALVVQIVTGVLLAMHYAPEIHLAFTSVEHIMRDVRGGVALRYIHANGASMFFIVVYLHMFRGLYYGSYFQPRSNLWYSGIIIFFLMMATAFMGYVLPWGQMSFWGATVITNLFSAIPVIGNQIVQLLWGGFSVDNPTLNRFFSFHYLVPFLIAGLAILHLILLHQHGSNNPLGVVGLYDKIPFYPYYYVKDLFAFFIFVWVFSFFVIYAPNYMGHPDNYIEANPLVTPAHIVPEWYFLPFYAVLRTIPDKLGGVVLMVLAIFVLALLPVVDTSVFRSNFFKPLNIWFFWYFFSDSLSLGWIGQEIVESPFIEMANFVTSSYFLYFIALLPIIGFIENAVIHGELNKFSQENSQNYSLGFLPVFTLLNSFDNVSGSFFEMYGTWIQIIQLGFILIYLLFLGTRYTRTGEFALVLNKISFIYIFFFMWMSMQGIVLNNILESDITLENSTLYTIFLFFASFTVCIFFYGIIDRFFIANSYETEYPILVLLIFLGAIILLRVNTFIEFIIAIEIVTFGTYVLVAYEQQNRFSVYAGVQYFILGSIPSAMLILAISWIYSYYGVMSILDLNLIANVHSDFELLKDDTLIQLQFNKINEGEIKNVFLVEKPKEYFLVLEPRPVSDLEKYRAQYRKDLPWEIHTVSQEMERAKMHLLRKFEAGVGIWEWDDMGYKLCVRDEDAEIALEQYEIDKKRVTDRYEYQIRKWLDYNNKVWKENMKSMNQYIQECELYAIISAELRADNITPEIQKTTLTFNWNNLFTFVDFKQHKILGILLFFSFNLFFKLTAAPFHFWALSIYEKAPISSVTILSIFTKLMVIFLIVKIFYVAFFAFKPFMSIFYIVISLLTAFIAIVGAFITPTLKKFFVYSSMGHVAFLLIPLAFFTIKSIATTFHYLAIYIISSFIMWFILYIRSRENHTLLFFKSLKSVDPLLGLIFSMLIFSMSGIPPFGGFYVKLDVLTTLIEHSNFYVTFILFVCTVASFFYYLRLIKIIYFDNKAEYNTNEVLSNERVFVVIVLFLVLACYNLFVQVPLLYSELEWFSLAINFIFVSAPKNFSAKPIALIYGLSGMAPNPKGGNWWDHLTNTLTGTVAWVFHNPWWVGGLVAVAGASAIAYKYFSQRGSVWNSPHDTHNEIPKILYTQQEDKTWYFHFTKVELEVLSKLKLQHMFHLHKTDQEIIMDLTMLAPYFRGGIEGINWSDITKLKENYRGILMQYHGQQNGITSGTPSPEVWENLVHLADVCTELLLLMHNLKLI